MGGRFIRAERLKQRKLIEELFNRGKKFKIYPFSVFYQVASASATHHKVFFAVSSRIIKKAPDRNKIKRRSRDSYRLKKHSLHSTPKLCIGYVYIANKILSYSCIRESIDKSIRKFNDISKNFTKMRHES